MRGVTGIGLIILAGSAYAGDVSVSAVLEPPSLPFQRTAHYTLVVDAPEALAITFPAMPELPNLEITANESVRETPAEGRQRVRKTWTLDPLFAGTYAIPALEVTCGESEKAGVPPVSLSVRQPTSDEENALSQFVPSVDAQSFLPRPAASWPAQALIVCTVLLAMAALAGLVFWWFRRAVKPLPPPAAWEVARQRLRTLDSRQLPQSGRVEAYYIDLSAILRYYIEDRFQLRAPEHTTPEFLEESARSGQFSPEQQAALERFLRHCDLVKFAQYQPSMEQMQNSFHLVVQFVEETVPAAGPAATPVQEAAA